MKLSERAMLVDFTVSQYSGRRKDKELTEAVVVKAKAESDTGSWWTSVVPASSMAEVNSAINQARVFYGTQTLPWLDTGCRILPAESFLPFSSEMRKLEARYWKGVDDFLQKYPDICDRAKDRLGDLYKPELFPDPSDLRAKFNWVLNVLPLPDATDFRVDLGDDAVKEIQENIERQVKGVMEKAVRDTWKRLHTVVSRVAERLNDPEGVFRDSLIGNVKELCDLLPRLNITEDVELARMTKEVKAKIAKQSPTELRGDKAQRQQTADAAEDILKRMAGYVGS